MPVLISRMKTRHDAFISYSHGADGRVAKALESGLERLAKPLLSLRALDVFRDESSLSANPSLWSGIETHLSAADWFVLLACPESAASAWCRRELRWWLDHRSVERMLIVVTGGELAWDAGANDFDWSVSTALSREAQGRYPVEPLYIDLRWARASERLTLDEPRFRDALLSLSATIRGLRKDELDGEDVRQLRRTRRILAAGAAAVSVAAVVATWQAIVAGTERDKATAAARIAEDERAKATAAARLAETERGKAVAAAAEADAERDRANQQAERANAQTRVAEAARAQAEDRRARAVALLAQQSIRRGDATTGTLSALAVLPAVRDRNGSADAEAALLEGWLSDHEQATLFGHRLPVWSVGYTPDGTRLLSASEDGSLRLWDLRDSPPRSTVLLRGVGAIRVARLSADGKYLVAAPESGELLLWRLDRIDAGPLRLDGHRGKVIAADFSADGSYLLTGSEDRTARLWRLKDAQPGSVLLEGHERPVHRVRFSADGREWITASVGALRRWRFEGEQPVGRLLADVGEWLDAVEFAPRGSLLATAARDKRLVLWQLDQPGPHWSQLDGHASWVWNITFDPGGTRLATTSSDGSARLWTWDGRRASSEVLERHSNWLFRPQFSGDGSRLLLPSTPTAIGLWDLSRQPPQRALSIDVAGGIASAAFSPDGRQIAIGSGDGTVRLHATSPPSEVRTVLPLASRAAMDAAWRADGRAFVVFHRASSRLHLWRSSGDRWISRILEGHSAGIDHAVFSPDGKWAASASRDGTARLWTVEGAAPPRVLSGHRFGLTRVAFSPDSRLLATASQDGTARIWRVGGADAPTVLSGHTEDVFFVVFTPQGRVLTVSRDRTARLWTLGSTSAGTRHRLLDARKPKAPLSTGHHRAALSADGRWLALSFDKPTVELWDLHAPRPSMIELAGATDNISHLDFTGDGRLVASTAVFALVWRLADLRAAPLELRGHSQRIHTAEFSRDGRRMATASGDGTVRIWHMAGEGTPPAALLGGFADADNFARFSPSGERLLTGPLADGGLALWEVPSVKTLVARSGARVTRCLTPAQREVMGIDPGGSAGGAGRNLVRSPPC